MKHGTKELLGSTMNVDTDPAALAEKIISDIQKFSPFLTAASDAGSAAGMLNDTFLGVSVVVLALTIWVIYVLIKDPKKTIQNALLGK